MSCSEDGRRRLDVRDDNLGSPAAQVVAGARLTAADRVTGGGWEVSTCTCVYEYLRYWLAGAPHKVPINATTVPSIHLHAVSTLTLTSCSTLMS